MRQAQPSKALFHALTAECILVLGVICAVDAFAQDRQKTQNKERLSFPVDTRLVQVSVIVQDKNGAPVRDLVAADFQLFDQGKEQTVETFSMQAEPVAGADSRLGVKAMNPPGFTNLTPTQGGVTVILIDRLNTAWEDQTRARDQIVKFLGQVQPNDRVGVYVLESSTVRVLHDFTTDATSLLRSIARYQATSSGVLAGSVEKTVETGEADMDAFLAESTRIVNAAFLRNRGESTCEALIAIANHLAGVSGRKNLIWVSSSFPMTFDDPAGRIGRPGLSVGTFADDVTRATRALSEAGVAVYPVDARGLLGAFSTEPAAVPSTIDSGRTARGLFTTLADVMSPVETSMAVAENTGGRAFYNTNDISTAIRRAVDDARVTYLIGYSPTHGQWDGRFREIKVKLRRPGLDVRHRKGYLALPPPEYGKGRLGKAVTLALQNPLQSAGIPMAVRVDRPEGAGPREVDLAIRLDPRPITLEQKGENWLGTIALSVAQTNAAGKLFRDFDNNIEVSLTREMKDRLLKEGLVLHKKVTLREDIQQLRVVVGDPKTLAVGSVLISAEKLRVPER